MNIRCFLTLFFLCTPALSATQVSLSSDSDYYTAGVVEFHSSRDGSASKQLENNLRAYLDIIASDGAKETDILVFPESVLNSQTEFTFVPDPAIEILAPCDATTDKYHNFLKQLSCQARNVSKYIVVNLSERDVCLTNTSDPRPCASNGFNKFNTDVVFDRQGNIISRYRKLNLWGENGTNITYAPQFGYFDTDFGVRFGYFICFDILFYQPGQEMNDKLGIQHFLFSARWFSQLPFLTANQIQSAWSYGNDVVLLAAGASDPDFGSSGSGIYLGRQGPVNILVKREGNGVRQLLVARVPKNRQLTYNKKLALYTRSIPMFSDANESAISTPLYLKRDPVELYTSLLIELTNGTSLKRELCTNSKFCCSFYLQWKKLNATLNTRYYNYRLAVYDGLRNEVAPTSNQLKNCAIISCLTNDIMDCGKYFEGTANIDINTVQPQFAFERIEISANFPKAEHMLIMPNSLKSNILPVPVEHFEWHQTDMDSSHHVRLVLNTTTNDLLTLAVYGNYYDTKASAANCLISVGYISLLLGSFQIFFKILNRC